MVQLKKWKSHKVVSAARIMTIEEFSTGKIRLHLSAEHVGDGPTHLDPDREWVDRFLRVWPKTGHALGWLKRRTQRRLNDGTLGTYEGK